MKGILRSGHLLVLGIALIAACAQTELPVTQVVVTLSGDADVMEQVKHLEARVYATDAPADAPAVAVHAFTLPASAPLSFGIARGQADRFVLVVEGYESEDTRVRPLIERKVRGYFEEGRTLQLDVFLASACLRLTHRCAGLQQTCRADARACGSVEEARLHEVIPGAEQPGDPPMQPALSQACMQSECPLPEYACVPTTGAGHVCLGQLADWPMPDSSAGSAHPPSYDLQTPGIVRDQVTGLIWEREPPDVYPGCSRSLPGKPPNGGACTWDEAKLYCHELTLGGLAWRLPSKIELTSIIDPLAASEQPFRGCDFVAWTSSPVVLSLENPRPTAWVVFTDSGNDGQYEVMAPGCVRCVAGFPRTPGTPGERYVMEPDAILDTHTGLTWRKSFSSPLDSGESAAAYCRALGSSFRLPTPKELLTLVDPARAGPAIDPLFVDTPSGGFWSVSLPASGAAQYHSIDFSQGSWLPPRHVEVPTQFEQGKPRARCVR